MAIWPVQPIFNANAVTLDKIPGTLPVVSDVIANWFQLLTFEHITKTTINFQVVETTTPMQFQGVVQPFTAQQLSIKPEGERSWKWYTIHAWPALSLVPDDVLVDQSGTQYRIMEKFDFKEYGYVLYHAVQDYSGSGPITG